jgi:hypothetical protein
LSDVGISSHRVLVVKPTISSRSTLGTFSSSVRFIRYCDGKHIERSLKGKNPWEDMTFGALVAAGSFIQRKTYAPYVAGVGNSGGF